MNHAHTYDRNMGTRRRQHTRRQRRSRQRAETAAVVVSARRRCGLASFTATASRQRRLRRGTAGDDRCDFAASTSAAPRSSRRRRRTARRSWSAPDHGVGSPVDRRQLTTSCRSGHAHECSGQQLTQSSRLNRRPFTFTTDV